MIIEATAIVTAIATAASAIYLARAQREEMARSAPPVKIREISTTEGLVIINLTVFPAGHQVVIRRISVPGARVAVVVYGNASGDEKYGLAHAPSDFVDVDFDLLPLAMNPEPVELTLALRFRSASKQRTSLNINLHSSRSFLSTKTKITAMINSDAD